VVYFFLGAIGCSTILTGDVEGVAGAPHDRQNLTLAKWLTHFVQKGSLAEYYNSLNLHLRFRPLHITLY
jgi:hypothetical protein